MERVRGERLASRWLSLETDEVKDIMTQIAEIERKTLFFFGFPGYGSLYHKRDIEGEPQIAFQVGDFCIGPVAKRQYWHDERFQMKIDRGPCEFFLWYLLPPTFFNCIDVLYNRELS